MLTKRTEPILEPINLPDRPLPRTFSVSETIQPAVQRVTKLIADGKSVLLTGFANALPCIDMIVPALAKSKVPSFSSGINPSIQRSVDLVALKKPNVRTMLKLKREKFVCVDVG